jgi:hypothetical protein
MSKLFRSFSEAHEDIPITVTFHCYILSLSDFSDYIRLPMLSTIRPLFLISLTTEAFSKTGNLFLISTYHDRLQNSIMFYKKDWFLSASSTEREKVYNMFENRCRQVSWHTEDSVRKQ